MCVITQAEVSLNYKRKCEKEEIIKEVLTIYFYIYNITHK